VKLPPTIALLLLAPLCGGCGSDNERSGERTSRSSFDFRAFDDAMLKFIADHSLRGASAVIVDKDGGLVHTAGYGEFGPERSYLIMSASKILSVGVIMRLVDQGLLDIDAPIGDYVSPWGAGKPELTVAQLVSGSSGLVGVIDKVLYAPYACQASDSVTLANCAKTIYAADDAADRKPPDTEFHYGGGAWQLAGAVAEVVSGKPWAELVQETYASCDVPNLGYRNPLLQVTFDSNPDGSVNISGIHYPASIDGNPETLPVTQNPSIEAGAYAKVADYGKILLMHLRGGTCDRTRVLSEAAVKRMQVDRILTYGGSTEAQMRISLAKADASTLERALDFSGYGLGWWINRAHPGIVLDPGAFGADAWLDVGRGYGAFIAIEGRTVHGAELAQAVKPVADAAFDAARR